MGAAQAPEPRTGYRARRRPAETLPAELSDGPDESESSEEEDDELQPNPLPNPFADDILAEQKAQNPFTDDVVAEKIAQTVDFRTRVWDPSQAATASSPTYKVSTASSSDGSTEEAEEEQQGSAWTGWWFPVGICLTDMPEVDTGFAGDPREAPCRQGALGRGLCGSAKRPPVQVGKLSAPFGRWSQFNAENARERAQKAQRKEVEYVMKCIARESARPSTSMNLLCANRDQYELLIHELRTRQFVVTNPVRTMYEEKTKELFELEGRIALPEMPTGDLREEWLLRELYHNPAHAERHYAHHVGTFKIFVHASLDLAKAKGQEAYFFSDKKHSHHHHYMDAALLLRVQW